MAVRSAPNRRMSTSSFMACLTDPAPRNMFALKKPWAIRCAIANTYPAGLGPAGYVFAIAHLIAHGFFKANMFLGAGSVKHAMNDEVDMRRFGALRTAMAVTFWAFLPGYLAIIGVPPFSGYFTKDPIIQAAFDSGGTSGALLGAAALIGAGITAFYMTRLVL